MLTLYSKNNCGFCTQAKKILDRYNIAYQEIKIDENATAKEFVTSRGHRTVPQIYLNEELFVEGGYNGLSKLTEQEIRNKLKILVE